MVHGLHGHFRLCSVCRAACREAARVTAPGGWFIVVSHVHPSSAEGEELLSEALLEGLRDSDPEKEALWSVDVHCEELEEDEHGNGHGDEGDGDEGQGTGVGPSVYMIRKVRATPAGRESAPWQEGSGSISLRTSRYSIPVARHVAHVDVCEAAPTDGAWISCAEPLKSGRPLECISLGSFTGQGGDLGRGPTISMSSCLHPCVDAWVFFRTLRYRCGGRGREEGEERLLAGGHGMRPSWCL